jgi:hypothetical protein
MLAAKKFLLPVHAGSERVPQSELQDSRVRRAEYSAKLRVSQRAVRAAEIWVVEQVESFRAELDTLCLGEMPKLERE